MKERKKKEREANRMKGGNIRYKCTEIRNGKNT